jgi:hypothetical protein
MRIRVSSGIGTSDTHAHARVDRRRGDLEPDLDAAVAPGLDRELAADEHCPLTHAAQPAVALGRRLSGEADSVVGHEQDDGIGAGLE